MRKNHQLIAKVTINVIRKHYLNGPMNRREVARSLKISPNTVFNYIKQFKKMELLYPGKIRNPRFFLPSVARLPPLSERRQALIALLPSLALSDDHKRLLGGHLWKRYHQLYPEGYSEFGFYYNYKRWKADQQLSIFSNSKVQEISTGDFAVLKRWRHSDIRRDWQKAVVIIGSFEGQTPFELADRTDLTVDTVEQWIAIFKKNGISGLIRKQNYNQTVITAKVNIKIENLFKILHQQPQSYDVNRTSWSLETLAETYTRVYKDHMSRATVSLYLRSRGFAFKKAREVLTSPDPNYRTKLDKIIAIVSHLGPNDRFFSIDEMGPFSVQIRGGRSYMDQHQPKVIPAHQKSKGYLICTAALELVTNQVTHFYSPTKSTKEMIRLLDILIVDYRTADKIYLSWDAASWHSSKLLKERIQEVNDAAYRDIHHNPLVYLAPLPISSQFLNVIESVFSGLAKAVLHNSDYPSVEDCKLAIDRYFQSRNEHFLKHPHRAGNKIWGKEMVIPAFSEAHNCKDPNVR